MDVTCVSTEVRVLKVLLIENDEEVARDVCFWLRVRYPQAVVVTVGEGRKGLDLVETEMPDLVMSASHLPDMNILKLITEIRGFCTVPIIILCKAQSDSERAIVLEAGADALIREPFAPLELAAWVRVMLRNAGAGGFCERDIVSISSKLSINFATQEVLVSGRPVRITPIEFRLLAHLVRNAGKLVSHQSLIEKVWGPDYVDDANLIAPHLCRLRRKLDDNSASPQLIRTERGQGYKLMTTS